MKLTCWRQRVVEVSVQPVVIGGPVGVGGVCAAVSVPALQAAAAVGEAVVTG